MRVQVWSPVSSCTANSRWNTYRGVWQYHVFRYWSYKGCSNEDTGFTSPILRSFEQKAHDLSRGMNPNLYTSQWHWNSGMKLLLWKAWGSHAWKSPCNDWSGRTSAWGWECLRSAFLAEEWIKTYLDCMQTGMCASGALIPTEAQLSGLERRQN